jgi:hypothetical membrane protein
MRTLTTGPAQPVHQPHKPATAQASVRYRTLGGVLLTVAGAAILMAIITAEALYPAAYDTHRNTISDLGAMRPGNLIRQPSAAIFDWTMMVTGIMVIVAAYCLYRALGRRAISIMAGLLGLGILGVGIFPGNYPAPHQVSALLAFTAGGIAVVLSWRVRTGPLRYLYLVLGAVALLSLVLGVFFQGWSPVAGLGEGGVERWVAYPVVLWMVSFGSSLCHGRDPDSPFHRAGGGQTGHDGT